MGHSVRRIGAVLVSSVLAIAFVAPTVWAGRAQPVSMVFEQNGDTYETLGWISTGAITDSGDWTVTRLVLGGPPTLLFGDVDTIQVGSKGTFRLQWHGGTTPVGGIAATWRLTDGTGAYARVRGEGRWSQEFTRGHITFRVWGAIHTDP